MWYKYNATNTIEANFLNLVTPRLTEIFDEDLNLDNSTLVLKKNIFYRIKSLRESISAKVIQE